MRLAVLLLLCPLTAWAQVTVDVAGDSRADTTVTSTLTIAESVGRLGLFGFADWRDADKSFVEQDVSLRLWDSLSAVYELTDVPRGPVTHRVGVQLARAAAGPVLVIVKVFPFNSGASRWAGEVAWITRSPRWRTVGFLDVEQSAGVPRFVVFEQQAVYHLTPQVGFYVEGRYHDVVRSHVSLAAGLSVTHP